MANPWIFEWYPPDQDLRPLAWRRAIGQAPVNEEPPEAESFLISNPVEGRFVRFRSFLGGSGPQYIPVNQDIPFEPGSRFKFVNVKEAQVDIKVLFKADSQELLWAMLRDLPYKFNPTRGIGTLKVTNPAAQERFLNCVCISGFRIDESSLQEKSVEVELSFWANDPNWYDAWNTQSIVYSEASTGALPILPSTLVRNVNDLVVPIQLENKGDVPTAIVVVITGPYKKPIIKNMTISSNPEINLSNNGGCFSLGNANSVTIDFINKSISTLTDRPGEIELAIRYLTTNSSFWKLNPGNNTIQLQIENVTTNTKVGIFFRSAYSTMI